MYEISKLVNEVISQSKELKREVVLKLGYRNMNKGYRRFNILLETGECPMSLKDMLPKALNVDEELVNTAFKLTAQQKAKEAELDRKRTEEYERKSFVPHIWIENELEYLSGASFWFVAFVGLDALKRLSLSENINDMDWELQKSLVKERILQHQKEVDITDVLFGKVRSYTYCQTYDDSFLFSVDGKFLHRRTETVDKPELYIEVSNKSISGGLLDKLGYRNKER